MKIKLGSLAILIIGVFVLTLSYSMPKNAKQEKEYFVIITNAALYESPEGSSKTILSLNFRDKVLLLNNKMKKNRFNVVINGTNGWINASDISITPKNWVRFDRLEGLIISYPKEYNYKFKRGKRVTDAIGTHIEECLYSTNSYIWIYHIMNKKFEQENTNSFMLDYYGVIAYYYDAGINEEDSTVNYELIILDKSKKGYYIINVNTGKVTLTPEEELIAKKILFSVRIKP